MHTVCAPSDFIVSSVFVIVTNTNEFFFSYLMNTLVISATRRLGILIICYQLTVISYY